MQVLCSCAAVTCIENVNKCTTNLVEETLVYICVDVGLIIDACVKQIVPVCNEFKSLMI